MRRSGAPRLADQTACDRIEPPGERAAPADLADRVTFTRDGYQVTIAIDVRDCIGCRVCLNHCQPGVLAMTDDKALIRLDRVQGCTLCFECERVCPVGAVVARKHAERPEPHEQPPPPVAGPVSGEPASGQADDAG